MRRPRLKLPSGMNLRHRSRVERAFRRFLGRDTYDQFRARAGIDEFQADPIFDLSEFERLAIWAYASSYDWHARINHALWLLYQARVEPSDDISIVCMVLNRALAKLPKFRGTVFRGYRTAPRLDRYLRGVDYKVGMILQWPAFLSTSRDPKKAYAGNVLFTISSRNGRVLSYYAPDPHEEEILFMCYTRFQIKAIERQGDKALVEMVEVDDS